MLDTLLTSEEALEAVLKIDNLPWGPFGPPEDDSQCRELEIRLWVEKREVLWERGSAMSILRNGINDLRLYQHCELLMKLGIIVSKIKAVVNWNGALVQHVIRNT